MTAKKTFTDDEGNKYELTPVLKTDENIMTLKPISTAAERKNNFRVEAILDDGPNFHDSATNLLVDLDCIKLTQAQAQAVADAIKALLSVVTEADDYNTQWYDMTVSIDAAREALQHRAEGNT